MTRDTSRRAGPCRSGASAAEIDALGGVIAAAAALADRIRSEAAGDLLRRALLLVRERRVAPADRARDAPAPEGFRPP